MVGMMNKNIAAYLYHYLQTVAKMDKDSVAYGFIKQAAEVTQQALIVDRLVSPKQELHPIIRNNDGAPIRVKNGQFFVWDPVMI